MKDANSRKSTKFVAFNCHLMTRYRVIFYIVFGVYMLIAFIFTLVMESSASILLGLISYVGWFKYITFFGVLLLLTDFVWLWMDSRNTRKQEEASRHENNILKAKVYDMQEGLKSKPEVPRSN